MIHKLIMDVEKRNQATQDFYLGGLGLLVKKRRMYLNMTQETLAKGICSNTYLSKFENNAAPINNEFIGLIMEKIELGYDSVILPDEMIEIFEKALDYYIRDDKNQFEIMMHSVKQVEFAILVDIARLGYYVTLGNQNEANELSENLYHFLTSMDSKALNAFMIFSAASKILNHRYDEALKILELFKKLDSHNADLVGIIAYQKFICYGNLGLINQSRINAEEARSIFVKSKNYRRLALIDLYQIEFSYYESETIINYNNISFLELLNQDEKDRFYLLLALGKENSFENLMKISKNSKYYVESLFLNCWLRLNEKNSSDFLNYKDELYQICLNPQHSRVNYHHWIVLMELGAYHDLRSFLLTHILPLAYQYQSVFLLKKITKEIASFSFTNKRYKDALYEIINIESDIAKLQNIKKPIGMLNPQSAYDIE